MPKIAVYAINCGSKSCATDSRGVKYQSDSTNYWSSFRTEDIMANVPDQDQQIYQAHSYVCDGALMAYEMPISQDGDYRLSVMIYNHRNEHNIRILLNKTHEVVKDLSVFDKVGRNVAHVEKIKFSIRDNELQFAGERSAITGNTLIVELTSSINKNIMISGLVLERYCGWF
jgi:hypothetical protein